MKEKRKTGTPASIFQLTMLVGLPIKVAWALFPGIALLMPVGYFLSRLL